MVLAPSLQRYQYRLLAAERPSTLEREMNDAAQEGYRVLPRTMTMKFSVVELTCPVGGLAPVLFRPSPYCSASAPACAHSPSSRSGPPESPIAPTIRPSMTSGMPVPPKNSVRIVAVAVTRGG